MISYATTRDRTDFASYLTSYTSSASDSTSDSAGGTSNSHFYTSFVSISDGISNSETSMQAYGTATNSDSALGAFSASSSQNAGTTQYGDATMGSVSQSFGFTSYFLASNSAASTTASSTVTTSTDFSTSFGGLLTATLFTQQETGYSYPRITTANVPLTSTHYIISGSGSSGFLTTAMEAVTAVSTTTDAAFADSIAGLTSTLKFSTYYDLGGIYSADTDWLWNVTAYNTSPGFVADIAESVDGITLWPTAVTVAQNLVSATDSGQFTGTYLIPGATSELDYQVLFSSTTSSSTIPSGLSIPFASASTSVPVWTTDSASMIVGNDPQTVTAVTTASTTATTSRFETYNATVTYPFGLNTSTTELIQTTSYFDTTTAYSIPPAYLASSSSSASGAYSEMGQTWAGTDLFYFGINVIPFGGGLSPAISPTPPNFAFVAPSDLRSAGNPYNFADNLSFTETIPYPNFSEVFSNVATPYPVAFTTSGADSHSFAYSWTNDTLKYTEWSTQLSGTSTATLKTKSSGVFASSSPMDSYFADGGTVYGGFPAIPTAAESVYFAPRAIIGTSVATDGASTTYRTLETLAFSSEISETAVIEQGANAYIIQTFLGDPGGGGLLFWARNPN